MKRKPTKFFFAGVLLFLLFGVNNLLGANRFSVATGNWNSTATWAATSGGTAGASVPVAGDIVTIEGNRTVTITANAACASVTIATGSTLNVGGFNFTVSATTTVSGSIIHTNTAGNKSYGNVIISGGTWTSNVAETYAMTSLTLSGSTINGSNTGIINVSGNLSVTAATTNTLNALTITVTGTTTIDGNMGVFSAAGTKTFVGLTTISSTGTWDNDNVNEAINFRGGLTNNGTFYAGTSAYTFDTNAQAISGTVAIPNVAVTGITLTNNGSLTVATALAGTGGLTNSATGTLNIGGTSTITTLTATAVGNTVNYTGSAQTVKATTYNNLTLSGSGAVTLLAGMTSVTGNLTLSGTATTTTVANLAIGGNFVIGTGTTFTTASTYTLSVTGTTNITGTYADGSTGAKTLTGNVTLNSGGVWNETAVSAYSIAGNFINNATAFTANTGTHTFTGNAAFSGSTTTSIPNVTVSGTYTNNGTLTVGTALSGAGGLTQGATGTLNLGGTSGITTLTATAVGNAVNYTGAAQTVKATTYNNLIFSGSGSKSIATGTSVTGNLSITGATASIGAGLNISVGTLTMGGLNKVNGTWGSTTATTATNKDNTYFAATTGYLTVTTDTRPTSAISGVTASQSICFGAATITLTGTVSSGTVYPVNGETVGVTINGTTQNASIAGGAGGFSINFTTPTIPASVTPYTITYAYTGDVNLKAAANNTSTALTVNTTPVQPSTITGSTSPCQTSSQTYSVTNVAGVTYTWAFPSGWTQTAGGTTYSVTATVGSGSGNVQVTPSNGCGNGTARTLAVTSISSVGGTLSGGTSPICLGSATGTMTLTGYTGTIVQWERQINSGGWTNINNGGSSTLSETPWSSGVWQYRIAVQNGTCSTVYSSILSITIDQTTVGGWISGSSNPICLGSSTGTMTINGSTGNVVRWERRVNSGTWENIANTLTTYSEVPSSGGTWEYRALLQSGSCPSLYATSFSMTVNPTLTITLGSNPVICSGTTSAPLPYSATTGSPSAYSISFNAAAKTAGMSDVSGSGLGASPIQINVPWNIAAGVYNATLSVATTYPVCSSVGYPITVTVTPATAISSQSTATQTQCLNGTFTAISVTATGTGTITYQWYSNTTASNTGGTLLTGATSASYTPLATATGTLYYYCIVHSNCGSDITSTVSGAFIVNAATSISSQSTATQTQCLNGTFTAISVTATGTGTITYQWYKNTTASTSGGTSLTGATNASYTPLATVAGTLYYYCIVSGTCGSVTSTVSGAFIVNPATAISSQSTATQTQCINGTFTAISVTATGTGTITYQWYSNTTASNTGGTSLTGATNASYTPLATATGTLYYYCIVHSSCGSDITSAVSGAFIVTAISNVTVPAVVGGNAIATLSWTNPASCYDEILIVANAGSSVSGAPGGDGTAYTANLAYGSGTAFTGGGYVVYKSTTSPQTITSLVNGTQYYFKFFTRKGTVWSTGIETNVTLANASLASDYYRSIATGNWNANATWQSSHDGTNWFNATLTPTSSANTITIQNTHTVTVTASVSVDQCTVNAGGQLTVGSGQTLTIADGAGTDLTVNGTLVNSGAITTTGTLAFGSGSTYQHAEDGGTIPTATWDAASNCNITGVTTTLSMGGFGQTFGNFTWNCAAQATGNFYMESNMTVAGNFTVLATGATNDANNFSLRMSNTATGYTINVLGNFIVSNTAAFKMNNSTGSCTMNVGGNFTIGGTGLFTIVTGGASSTLSVTGNVSITGGTLDMNENDNVSIGTLNVGGNFTLSGGNINTTTSTWPGTINFNGNTTHIYTNTAGTYTNTVNVNVNSPSVLDVGTSIIDGSDGTFTLNSGAGIITGHAQGLSTTAATGSIQVTGTKTYNAGANYTYDGTSAQVTGNGLTGANNLTINNATGVTLTSSATVIGILNLTSGILTTGANAVTLTNNSISAITGGSTANFVNGALIWQLAPGQTYLYPIGKGATYLPFGITGITGTTPGVRVEAFTASTGGTATNPLGSLSTTEYWLASVASGTYTNGSVSLTRQTALAGLNAIGRSATLAGAYSTLNGTASGTSLISSDNTGNTLGYFVMANKRSITTSAISGSPFCAGSAVSVPYTIIGTYTAGNIFTAQISDASGSFTSYGTIGTITSTAAGTISGTIPAGTATGSGYRIRVVSSTPAITGTDNLSNLNVTAILSTVAISPVTAQSICIAGSGSLLTATETDGGTITARQWGKRSVSGGTITAIAGATGSTYTPLASDLTAGTWFIVCTSTPTCGSAKVSNEVTVTVNSITAISSQSTATQTQCLNGTFTAISVTASGATVTYQWYSNTTASTTGGTLLTGATGASYTPLATAAGTLYYYCIVSGTCGSVTSAVSGAFIVNPATAISSQSTATQTQCLNGTFTAISVTATGTGTITYQWYKNTTASTTGGTLLTGATSASYIPLATATGTLYYYCIVHSSCGSDITSTVSGAFIVNTATVISSQSTATQTQCINGTFTAISVTATGTGTITYQWYSNTTASTTGGILLTGATSASYTPLSTTTGTLYYYCIVHSDCGTNVTSAVSGAFIVNTGTTISSQSTATQTQCLNGTFTAISVTASGTGTITYQWYSNATASTTGGTLLTGATSASYTPLATSAGTLYYYCTVGGTCGSVTSAVSGVFVVTPATAISSQSTATQTQCLNGTFTAISVTATGTGTITYQWYSNATASTSGGTLLTGATSASYTPLATVTGTLYYYCIVHSDCGANVTSAVSGAFIVNTGTAINSQSTATQTQCLNGTFTAISVTASGATITYQWYSNTTASTTGGTLLTGATSASYTPLATAAGTLYYYCIVSGTCGSITSAVSGVFIVNPATAISSQSTATQTQCLNGTFTAISVTATGTGTITYQWYKNTTASTTGGTILSGATNASYTPLATATGTLYYYCIVHSDCGTNINSAVSGAFIVNTATVISSQSTATQTQCINGTFTAISVTATGTGTINYQWYSNTTASTTGGTLLTGATSASYTPLATAAGTLYYYCIVSGTCGSVTSAVSGAFIVNTGTVISSQSTATQTQCLNGTFTAISVTATGTGTITYQWYSNTTASTTGGTLLTGAISANYTPLATVAGTLYYYCIVSGTCGSLTSAVSGAFIVNIIPIQPSAITGSATPCQTSSQIYSVTNVANVIYTWTFPAGWAITVGQSTSSVTVTVGAGSGNVQVVPSNSCGTGTAQTLAVVPTTVPAQPSTITGSITPCQSSSQTYSVTNVANVTYTWTIPAGWTQTGGGITNSITVTVGAGSGNIQVIPSNGCGAGTAQTLAVVPTAGVPAQPSTITGSTAPCQSSTQTYSVTNVAGVTYTWTFPTGWTQTGGGTTNSVTVTVGAGSGNVQVTPSTACGNGTAQTLAITTATGVPAQPSVITGSAAPCQNSPQTYSVTNVTGVNYSWALPAGWIQTGGGTTNSITVTVVGSGSGSIQVTPSNACGSGVARSLAVAPTNVPAQTSAITGSAAPCQTSSQTYSVTNVAGVTYTWTFPTGWTQTAGGTTYSVTATVGAGSGSVQVTPSNTCGNGTSTTLTVTPTAVPAQPSAITGSVAPCRTSSQIYTVTNVSGVTYTWTFPAGWNITAGGTTSSVTVTVGTNTGNIVVTPSNTCGSGTAQTLVISSTTAAVPVQPAAIAGSVAPCQNSSQIYSVTSVAGVAYAWTFPTGWLQTGGGTSNSVTVTVGTGTGNVQVIPSNSCGSGTARTLAVTPLVLPAQPSAITGNAAPCQTSSQTYSVTNAGGGVTYNWTFPTGWTQTGGTTTNSVTVTVGSGSGNVQVVPSNGGCLGTAQTLAVAPTTVPAQPSAIIGNATPCQASSQTYSVTNVANVTYTWTFPTGWTKTAGGTTNSVTVTIGAGTGNVQVTPSNACGNGTAQTLAVTPTAAVPAQPSTITGNTTVCQTTSQTYSVTNVAGVTYTWTFPTGWTQTAGGTTNSITVTVGTVSGNVQVTPSTACGSGPSQSLAVTATVAPSAPATTGALICIGSTATLSASGAVAGQTYKWYDAATAGNLLKTSASNADNTYTTAVIAATTNYWVSILNAGGCESPRTSVIATFPSASPDDSSVAGTDSWIGHVYDGMSFTTYYGTYTETETFNESFGGATTCFALNSSLGTRSIYTESFSVHYRMNSTKRGLYIVDLGSDDGSRLTVDGTLLYNNWADQAYVAYPRVLMSLKGTSSLVYDYYENAGANQVVFQNLIPVLSNTLSTNTSQTIYLGNTGSAISGDVYGTLPTGITLSGTGYQWTYSTTPSGTRTNITGATGATFTPNSTVAPFNTAGTYYVFRNASLSSTNNVAPNPYVATNESNAATITVGGAPTITTSTATLTGFNYSVGFGPSAEQSFTVSGSNLPANLTIIPSANFEISTGTGASFVATNPIVLSVNGGNVSATTIYVRMMAGHVVGSVPAENIGLTSGAVTSNVACSGTVVSLPVISTSVTSLSGFSYPYASPSPSSQQTFTVSGINLVANVTVTPSASFEISTTSGSGFVSTPITLTQSGGTLGATTIYVRMKLGLGIGHYSENIVSSSTNATSQNVTVNGDIIGSGTIITSTSSLAGFIYTFGSGPSAPQSFTVTGTLLGTNNVVITPATNYAISLTSGGTYQTTALTLTQSGGTVNTTTIYIRLVAGLAVNTYPAINIPVSSAGAITKSVGCSGAVVAVGASKIMVSKNTLTGFGYMSSAGGPSTPQSFTVSGASLSANVSVSPPSNYEISLTPGGAYQSTALILTQTGGILSPTTIYARLKSGLSSGNYTGVNISVASSGAVTQNVACVGIVFVSPLITAGISLPPYCEGSTVNLTSTGESTIANRFWQGPNSFYSALQNPVLTNVTTAMSGTYTVTGNVVVGGNLVTNGDFESGNTSFGTSYALAAQTTNGLWPESTYDVLVNPNSEHPNFIACGDHTTGTGKQMVVNGSGVAGAVIWTQSVPVIPNAYYQFTYWVQSVVAESPSQLQLYVNGVAVGPVYTADFATCSWKQFAYNATAGSSTTSMNLELINQNTALSGNDFALDDIVFQQILPATSSVDLTVNPNLPVSVSLVASPNPTTTGTNVTFTATPTNGGANPSYVWKVNGTTVPGVTGATYSSSALKDGDIVTVVLSSSLDCKTGNPATSNTVIMMVSTRVNYWYGYNSTDWGTASNWTAGYIPAAGDDVEFATATNFGSAAINDLYLDINRTIGSLIDATVKSTVIPSNLKLTVNRSLLLGSSAHINASAKFSTIEFAGTLAQTIPTATFTNDQVYDININNSNNVMLYGTMRLLDVITAPAGRLDATTQSPTVVYAGDPYAKQTIYMNRYLNNSIYNLGIYNGFGVWLSTTASIYVPNDCTITKGVLTVPPGATLTVDQNTYLNYLAPQISPPPPLIDYWSCLVLKSDSVLTGSFVHSNLFSGIGSVKVERYMSHTNNWHLYSSPIQGKSIHYFLEYNPEIPDSFIISSGNPDVLAAAGIRDYNTVTNSWNPKYNYPTSPTGTNTIGLGKGFNIRTILNYQSIRGTGSIDATGIPNDNTVNVPITRSAAPTDYGWNCIGNPFTCALNIRTPANDGFLNVTTTTSSLDPNYLAVYVWDTNNITGGSAPQYIALNYTSSITSVQTAQGFFVKSKVGGGSVTFTKSMQLPNAALSFKDAVIEWPSLKIVATDQTSSRSAEIKFVTNTTKGLDPGYDAGLYRSNSPFEIYSKLVDDDDVDYTLQCLPDQDYDQYIIPIGIDHEVGGQIIFTAETANLPSGCHAVLEDRLNKNFVRLDLKGASYRATLDPNTKGIGRFFLHTSDVTGAVQPSDNQQFKINSIAKTVYVFGEVSGDAKFYLYSVDGKLLAIFNAQNQLQNQLDASNYAAGVYLLKIIDRNLKKTIKFVLEN